MALDKAISSGKEKRKAYRGPKAVDKCCRNHGGCEWCLKNRKYQENKVKASCDEKMKNSDD